MSPEDWTTTTLHCGDCLVEMAKMPEASVDSVITDPPYHLTSIVKRFSKPGSAPAQHGTDGAFTRASRGFMGKEWDGGDIAFKPETWAAVLRVLKPGGHLLAFGSSKGSHRMVCAIEDAGFEIRDTLMWLYGTGMPKSHNQAGEWDGWGSGLKPAFEPIVLARRPLVGTIKQNLESHRTGALNIEGCRVPSEGGRARDGEPTAEQRYTDKGATNFAMTPGPRGGDPKGRWPANLLHDGSDEVIAAFPEAPGQLGASSVNPDTVKTRNVLGAMKHALTPMEPRNDAGSAARFFWSAKATKLERAGSTHPTVKPIALLRYLCRLVTPPGGTVLDPFAGTGTTGSAARAEGFNAVLIEAEPDYQADIRRRFGMPEPAPVGVFA